MSEPTSNPVSGSGPVSATPVIVQKYGGSSVADVDRIRKVADRIVATKRAGNNVVVVVSAMGRTTDGLVELARSVDPNPPRRELDMLVTTGERVSMALLSMAIQRLGCDAISFTGSQSGIITTERHFDARILEVRPHRIQAELARGRIVIVAGYQGMSRDREITTLGRGGSDTTAVALAAALGATQAEIYSDVDGVYSADPRVVPDAEHLANVSYDQMQEMAEAGAKVLNATAVAFARDADIAIFARSTFEDHPTRRETRISTLAPPCLAVVGSRDVTLLDFPRAAWTVVEEILARCETYPTDLFANGDRVRCRIETKNAPQFEDALTALRKAGTGIRTDTAVVSLVGDDAAATTRRFASTTQSYAPDGVDSWPNPFGTARRVSALVNRAMLDDAVSRVHAEFVSVVHKSDARDDSHRR